MYTFMKVFFKTYLSIWFSHVQIQQFKVIYDLNSQCLTKILSKTTFFVDMEGVSQCKSNGYVLRTHAFKSIFYFPITIGFTCHSLL